MTEWRPMSYPAKQCMTVPDIVGWLYVTECRHRATDCDVTPTQRNSLLIESDKTLGQAGFLRVCVRSMGVAIRLDVRHLAMQFGWWGWVLGQHAILAWCSRFVCKICRGQKLFSRSLSVSWGFSTVSVWLIFGQSTFLSDAVGWWLTDTDAACRSLVNDCLITGLVVLVIVIHQ